jgi:hypothetical protein
MKPLLVLLVAAALVLGQHAEAAPANIQSSFLDSFNGPFPTLGGYAGTEISSTVSLLYQNDWDVNYLVSCPCPASSLLMCALVVDMQQHYVSMQYTEQQADSMTATSCT